MITIALHHRFPEIEIDIAFSAPTPGVTVAAFGFVFTFRDVPTPPHLNGTAETPEDEQ